LRRKQSTINRISFDSIGRILDVVEHRIIFNGENSGRSQCHLNKAEIAKTRTANVIDAMKDVKAADAAYKIWQQSGAASEFVLKKRFDDAIAKIKSEIKDTKPFARARQCAVLLAKAQYSWIGKYIF